LRAIAVWILRFGIIEAFLIGFATVNLLTFLLSVKVTQSADKHPLPKTMLIILTLALGGIGAFLGFVMYKAKQPKCTDTPADSQHKSRKQKLVLSIGLVIAIIPLIHIAHGLTLSRIIRYIEINFTSENWPSELDGYRIAFMTDLHTISDDAMRNVAADLNERNLDLLLLGGDFSMHYAHYVGTLREIAQIRTTDGIFGVEGNHDAFFRLFPAMEQLGMIPLDNSGMHIQNGFFLAGVQDMWNRNPYIAAAVSGAYPDDFILLVSHNPDVLMRQPSAGIDLVLAGHTHRGQISFFGYPMYLLLSSISHYGTRFSYGFSYSADGVPMFVSSGLGPYYNIPRIFSRPEVVIFTMLSQ